MSISFDLRGQLALPVLCAPMFIVSVPELVYAQCISGVIGSFPALNARPQPALDDWLTRLTADLAAYKQANPAAKVAPFAVNQIVHKTNDRLEEDFVVIERHKVPLVITSLRAPAEYVPRIHGWGGRVFHDVINIRHAEKALEAGVDGLILVCAGAGGHAGRLNPMAFVAEIRRFYDGPLILSGAITRGEHIAAALAMGADLAYIGTRFIATREANAAPAYKQMIVDSSSTEIVYTPYFSAAHGSYLRRSIEAAGLDADALIRAEGDTGKMVFSAGDGAHEAGARAWRDIWSAGQGVGGIDDIPSVADLVSRLETQFAAAKAKLNAA
jgi:nitronate monooxygenase